MRYGKLGIACIMRRYAHDGARADIRQHVRGQPHGHRRAREGVGGAPAHVQACVRPPRGGGGGAYSHVSATSLGRRSHADDAAESAPKGVWERASSPSEAHCCWKDATRAASAGLMRAAVRAGWSGARATKVTPASVSARVVNTDSVSGGACQKE